MYPAMEAMMITPLAPRPDNGAIQGIEARPMTVQADPARDSLERDLAKYSYFSPVLKIDVDTQKAVLQYRNAETGDVERQYPSKERLKAYGGSGPGVGAQPAMEPAAEETGSPETSGNEKPVALVA
jgi:hypothetical protein